MRATKLLETWRDRVVAALVLSLFLVPAVILAVGPKPSRFSFQMYSGYGQIHITWTDAAGVTHPVGTSELLASPRIEIDWTQLPSEVLCSHLDAAIQVDIERTGTDGVERRTVRC